MFMHYAKPTSELRTYDSASNLLFLSENSFFLIGGLIQRSLSYHKLPVIRPESRACLCVGYLYVSMVSVLEVHMSLTIRVTMVV